MKNTVLTFCIVILYIILGKYIATQTDFISQFFFGVYSLFFIAVFGYGIYCIIKILDKNE